MSTNPKGRRSRLPLLILALIVLAGAGYAFRSSITGAKAPAMMTATVSTGNVEETVLATGTLKPSKLVAVGAQVSGRVTALKVELGQQVNKGDLIAEIDSVTQENALRTSKAALANIRAQRVEKEASLLLAEQTLARQKSMLAQKAVSQADFETADANVKTTRAQIEALDASIIEAEVAVSTAEANLGYTQITAPIDGTVLAVVTQEGQTVNAAQSAPTIVIMGQLDVMTVRAEISEADIVRVSAGQPIYFTILSDPERRYEATLASIEPAPESIRSDSSFSTSSTTTSSSSTSSAIYYNGIFNVPNEDGRLRTYMTAEVHIVLGKANDVLTVPAVALGPRNADGSYTVRVVEGDKITPRKVDIGLNDKVIAEVKSGLKAGDKVVTGEGSATASAAGSRRMGGPPPMGF
ncbi:efflux RND transporter periplasmic adaptor subunit [Kaistia nematophila]|uniref:Efflux RND transporter periplasmic adaptor subunit n=1 Tax=Kaistia nematophila TaxID=2994654 RepID=A0A9X3E0Z4_9HYPH|nr:efflux RND transporter periplasmic adaptor subunit [Kaistia nematophila]MCX5569018.1 efflux RND transporter periplasmic adaptor subunit [Kaistia nematophila]